MKRTTIAFLFFAVSAQLAGAADRGAAMKRAQEAIRDTLARFTAAEGAANAIDAAACFDSDASLLPPSGPPLRGREEIEKRFRAVYSGAARNVTFEVDETWVMDNWAMSRGIVKGEAKLRADGSARPIQDKYLMLLKKHGDRWEIHTMSWNPF